MAKFEEVTLNTACEGSAPALFARGLKEVLDNILDVNTDPEATRKITMTFTFYPTEDRASSSIGLDMKVTPARVSSIGGTIIITKEGGQRKAYANATKQEPLFPQEKTEPTVGTTATA